MLSLFLCSRLWKSYHATLWQKAQVSPRRKNPDDRSFAARHPSWQKFCYFDADTDMHRARMMIWSFRDIRHSMQKIKALFTDSNVIKVVHNIRIFYIFAFIRMLTSFLLLQLRRAGTIVGHALIIHAKAVPTLEACQTEHNWLILCLPRTNFAN